MASPFRPVVRGFTLIEVMISLAISTILMVALSGLFVQSVKSRQQVDRDGQKIENGRYALDVLSEDIRLAGYWGTYSPSGNWSSVDWKPVSPFGSCSPTAFIDPKLGWSSDADSVTTIPAPILGFEAHDPSDPIANTITACLADYYGGDVIVVRRASTVTTDISYIQDPKNAAKVKNKSYIQASGCSDELAKNKRVRVKHSSQSNELDLHSIDCVTLVKPRELITRVYYLAANNESNDGVPTLKVLDFGDTIRTPKTIAPGVEHLHIEYGLDNSGGDGATDTYQLSKGNPLRLTALTPTTLGTALGGVWGSSGGEDLWEDVMAVKLYVVVRDLETTTGYTNTASYNLGQVTVTPGNTAYKTRMSTSAVRVVNMSSRREQ